jgi:hypothetical protein
VSIIVIALSLCKGLGCAFVGPILIFWAAWKRIFQMCSQVGADALRLPPRNAKKLRSLKRDYVIEIRTLKV